MTHMNIGRAVLIALVVASGPQGKPLATAELAAQATRAPGRSLPTFEVDRAWPKVPPQWKLGDASSIAIDAQDNVWVLHRPRTLKPEQAAMAAPPVIVFDPAGTYIKAWGGAGNGYEWPEREHGIHIDYKGFVWLGGNSCPTNGLPGLKPVADDQLLKFSPDGKFIMQIGRSNQSKGNDDTRNLHRPADVWVHPQTNELFVADGYGNHRVAVFDADTGAFKRMWGAFGRTPSNDDHCEVVTPTSFSDPGPEQFSIVHAIRVARDGTVYVADREYRRVQMFTSAGKFVKQLVRNSAPFARDLALSPDADQQFLYVGGGTGVFIVDRKTLEIVGNVQPAGMIGAGHQIATDSKGNLYIAQTTAGMQKLTFKGMSPASR
jgi:DNA-binding beta-propeller fold protein YncE